MRIGRELWWQIQQPMWLAVAVFCGGCAIHYYDNKTGTEHLWGFGHMKMKACPAQEGIQAVVKGTETGGLKVSMGEEGFGTMAGYESCRRIVLNTTNCSLRLEWPDSDFFNVRVGSLPPFFTNQARIQSQTQTRSTP